MEVRPVRHVVERVTILGGGSWGTALTLVLARTPQPPQVTLWVHDACLARQMSRTRENPVYLPGFRLPESLQVTSQLDEAVRGAELIVGAIPSAYARQVYRAVQPHLTAPAVFLSATKGLETDTLLRMSQVIEQVIDERQRAGIAALSGPSFAVEVARGDPTAVVVACPNPQLAAAIQQRFSGPTFRVYSNPDLVGVELAGALKNIIAIAAGICVGLGYGHNALAALVTRGAAEISRLASALGAQPKTLAGLAGIGDLMLTATGSLSRNRALGIELARGRKLEEILAATRTVAEGVNTTRAALELARRYQVEMPITEQIYQVLYHGRSPLQSIADLMQRPLREE